MSDSATLLPIPPHSPGVVTDGSQTALMPNTIVKGEVTVLIGG